MKPIYLPLLAALAGCVTVPAPARPSDEVRHLVLKSADELRQLLRDISSPAAVPDYAGTADVLAETRVALAREAATGNLSAQPALAALGVTLTLCADGLEKLQSRERPAAARLAQGEYLLTCVTPLSLLSLH